MLLHEFLQHVLLLLFLAGRLPLALHLLIIHHLLDHASRLAVEIAEFRVLGLDLGDVDLGGGGDDVCPPLRLVLFVQVDGDFFAGRRCFERPGALVERDGVGEVALDSWARVSGRLPAI